MIQAYYSTGVLLRMRIILTSTNVPVEKPVENLPRMRIIINKPYCNRESVAISSQQNRRFFAFLIVKNRANFMSYK